MFELLLSGVVLLPFLAGALHPLLGWCIQKGTRLGIRQGFIVGIANCLTALIFFIYLKPGNLWPFEGKDWWAIANGVIFFFGQWFSIQSVKSGDIAVHSSALGIKVMIVAVFSLLVGLEEASVAIIAGVLLSVLSIYLVSGGSLSGWREHRKTVGLTLIACFFFGVNDFLTGWLARDIGSARWMFLMIGTAGVVSVFFIIPRLRSLPQLEKPFLAWMVVFLAGLLLGLQALLINLALSEYGKPTMINIIYSSRGVLAVIFVWAIGRQVKEGFRIKQFVGALLMLAALALTLS